MTTDKNRNSLISVIESLILTVLFALLSSTPIQAQWNPIPIPIPTLIPFPFELDSIAKRVETPRPLLFNYATNQAGFDTEIVISNTSKDSLGSTAEAGTCTIYYYGKTNFGGAAPLPQTSNFIAAGEDLVFLLSTGSPAQGISGAPGFQGYIIADCTFPMARGISVLSDIGNQKLAAAQPAEVLSLPRSSTNQPILFSAVSNQNGMDTGIVIANTSLDNLGSTSGSGSCTLNYYGTVNNGGAVPAYQTSQSVAAGEHLIFTLSTGGTHGIVGTPGFKGYIIADCNFPMARGYSFTSDLGASQHAHAESAEVITVPRDTASRPLLFNFATNRAGFDTTITISNTTLDSLGTSPQSGSCTVRYHGTVLVGQTPAAQTSTPVAPGGQLEFSLSSGNAQQNIAGAPGFQGYLIVDCGFPLARGISTVYDSNGPSRLAASEAGEIVRTPRKTAHKALLFPHVTNQAGSDTGIVITNTSEDSLGSTPKSGTCRVNYYGETSGGGNVPAAFTTPSIPAGDYAIYTLSTGGTVSEAGGVIPAAPGFRGYAIARCNFPMARGYSFVSDLGASKRAYAVNAEIIDPADGDVDGTPDYDDGCPYDGNKTNPGQCGCGVADTDSDSDGTPNCNDSCPQDAAKAAPGVCGCGQSDTDADNNGVIDCLEAPGGGADQCPVDPQKTSPGFCGCGVSDADSDSDGNPDCTDACSQDPAKDNAGVCGCGRVDIDSDSNGVIDCLELSADTTPAKPEIIKRRKNSRKIKVKLQRYQGSVVYKVFIKGRTPNGKRVRKTRTVKTGSTVKLKLKSGRYKIFYKVGVKQANSKRSPKAKVRTGRK